VAWITTVAAWLRLCAEATGSHRPGDVAGDLAADEQHLAGQALRGGDHQVVEGGPSFLTFGEYKIKATANSSCTPAS